MGHFKKIGIFSSFIIFILFCSNCGRSSENGVSNNSPLKEMGNNIIGKKIELSSILKSDWHTYQNSEKPILVFLFTGLDCSSCVMKGLEVLKNEDVKRMFRSIPISVGGNNGIIQLRSEFKEYIYQDSDDLIRKTLKYVYTPVIFSVDKDSQIKEVFFLTNNSLISSTIIKKLTK